MNESTVQTLQLREESATPDSPAPRRNISRTEQIISTVGGSALLVAGLLRGKGMGLLTSAVGGAFLYRGWTGHCHAYEAMGVDTADHEAGTVIPAQQGVKVDVSITVNRPAQELYAFWSRLENLPQVMRHLESVEVLDEKHSRWTAIGPFGKSLTWDAETITQRESEIIAWRSLPESDVQTAGSVRFQELPHKRGTALVVSLKYNLPAGKIADTVASWMGKGLEQDVREDLRRFKATMEAGEVPTTNGQPKAH